MKTLVIAEHDHAQLKMATHHTVMAATKLSQTIDLLIIGSSCEKILKEAQQLAGITRVLVADHPVYAHQLPENSALLVAELAKNYSYILAPASTFGKNLLPRIAALLNVAVLSDVVQIVSADTFIRPMYAGNIMATVQLQDAIKLLTIRTTAFKAVQTGDEAVPYENISIVIENPNSRFEGQIRSQSLRPELTNARVIVSGGRGLKSAENFHLLEALADHLGAAIGASRAAVDAGYVPNDYQIGQTGKVVAPELYIAVGISGAIQHLAGMKESKVIVAINQDPEAPIFQAADYGLVGDLFKILPELQTAFEQANLQRR